MRIWYLGDSVFAEALASLTDDLIDSSVPDAIMEHVWTEQVFDTRIRDSKLPCNAVIFINNPVYDSEVIIELVRYKVNGKIVLVVYPANAPTTEGMLHHYVGERYKLVRLNSLEINEFKTKVQDALK